MVVGEINLSVYDEQRPLAVQELLVGPGPFSQEGDTAIPQPLGYPVSIRGRSLSKGM